MISVVTPSIRPKGLEIIQDCLKKQTLQDFEWLVELGLGKEYDLNRAQNRMLRRAKGELIVFLQDFIQIPNNGLESFWNAYQSDKNTFFTAPVGKTLDYKDISWDWRTSPGASMDWTMWEIDWAAAPLKAIRQIGGFDEWLDGKTWTFDNVNVGCRADMAGFKFKNLMENKAIAYNHDAVMPHPFRSNWHPEHHNERLNFFRHGNKIDYLKS